MPFDSQENPHCNVANMLAVADKIAADPKSLNMGYYHPQPSSASECGTAMCIAGWATYISDDNCKGWFSSSTIAQSWLGLSCDVADRLFVAFEYQVALSEITAPMAVQAIHNVIEKGDPDWDRVQEQIDAV